MNKGNTLFLKVTVCLIGLLILAIGIFGLPRMANYTATIFPEFAYLQYPILLGMYITVIPFFIALYQAFVLLQYIDKQHAFSDPSVKALRIIKYCAITISIMYVIGSIYLLTQNALHPGIVLIGCTIIFASAIIAVFAAVLQMLLKNAIDLKSENEFTV